MSRSIEISQVSEVEDALKKVMFVQPGGWYNAFTSGFLSHIKDFIPADRFDEIHAGSSGSITAGLYLLHEDGRDQWADKGLRYKLKTFRRLHRGIFINEDEFRRMIEEPYTPEQMPDEPELHIGVAKGRPDPRLEYIKANRDNVLDLVVASCSIPGVFEPKIIDGEICYDSGALDPEGVNVLQRAKREEIKAVLVYNAPLELPAEPNRLKSLVAQGWIQWLKETRHLYPHWREAIERYNETMHTLKRGRNSDHLFVVTPQQRLKGKLFEKNPRIILENYHRGRRVADEMWAELEAFLTG